MNLVHLGLWGDMRLSPSVLLIIQEPHRDSPINDGALEHLEDLISMPFHLGLLGFLQTCSSLRRQVFFEVTLIHEQGFKGKVGTSQRKFYDEPFQPLSD